MTEPAFRTLGLAEAARLLKMHKNTLQANKAIPRAKLGRALVFVEADLLTYIRSQYQASSSSLPCPTSTNSPALTLGMLTSRSPVSPGYVGRLEQMIASRRKKSATS
jgi:hypothetical protein